MQFVLIHNMQDMFVDTCTQVGGAQCNWQMEVTAETVCH